MGSAGGLEAWVERSGRRRPGDTRQGCLRFAFYVRVSAEEWQDPESSLARQREQAGALVRGHGAVMAEFFDVGQSRTVAWGRRPQAEALVAQLADLGRGWDAIVVGEYERPFYGSQYALTAPLFEHYGIQLWMPEGGGWVDFASEHDERAMTVLGLSSKRRSRAPASGSAPRWQSRRASRAGSWAAGRRTGTAAGRAQHGVDRPGAERLRHPVPVGGRPRAEPAPHGRVMDAADGRVDPLQSSLLWPAGPEPAAHRHAACRPGRHQHGAPAGAALESPRRLVISARPAHPALVSEDDFIAAQDVKAARGPVPGVGLGDLERRQYLLAGLLMCGTCGRRMESAWSNGNAAYRCRHGRTSATGPDPGQPKNAYIRQDRILAHLPALRLLLPQAKPLIARRRRTRRGADVRSAAGPHEAVEYLRAREIGLTYDQATGPVVGIAGAAWCSGRTRVAGLHC